MKKNKIDVNLIIYILIGLIVVIGIVLLIPDNSNNTVPTDNTVKKEVIFTTTDTEFLLKVGESKQINYTLSDNYNINWFSSNNGVATVSNGLVTAINGGIATITGSINVDGSIKVISIKVTVEKEEIPPEPVKPQIEKIVISNSKISVVVGETKTITYTIEPSDGELKTVKWESADTSIAAINDGVVTGIKEGTTTITLNVNEIFIGKVEVVVKPKITGLELNSESDITLRIGETSQITAKTVPVDSNVKIVYKSSNSNVTVSDTGLIKAITSGTSVITLTADKYVKTVKVTVRPKTGVVDGTGIWAYTDNKVVNPVRAHESFFNNLVKKGIGSMSGTVYTYGNYSYDYTRSTLTTGDRTSMVRIYYPNGYDLSNVNTFTFIGGSGELNWGSFFSAIDKDTSLIKSSGIIILISGRSGYDCRDAINATEFVKAIVKQNKGMKNAVGGYSLGGPSAGRAAYKSNYDSLYVVNTYLDATDLPSLRDKEIYIYSPRGDSMYKHTKTLLNRIVSDGQFKNVTVVTNNTEIINNHQDKLLIVNPGSAQGSGHGYNNIANSNMFAYACK